MACFARYNLKMPLRSIANNLRQQNWSTLFLELLVVIFGLVLAFQVDRWWEERGDRSKEQEYIARLIIEVRQDIELISYAIDLAEVRQGFGDLLIEVAGEPDVAEQQPAMFLAAVAQAAFTFTPTVITQTYDEIRSTGSMGLVRSEDIKRALYNYHSFDDTQQQYIQLNLGIELRYFELVSGVLDAHQYQWVQDQWFVVDENDLKNIREAEPDRSKLKEAVERFTGDTELINWIPRTRGVQREHILMNGIRLNRAKQLLESLELNLEKAN